MTNSSQEKLCGKSAAEYLESQSGEVSFLKKDNTDKLRSYKSKGTRNREFAFDSKTKTKLSIWVDLGARYLENLSFVEVVQYPLSNYSTALDRVFSGGIHTPKTKLIIHTEEDLKCFISWLRHAPELN